MIPSTPFSTPLSGSARAIERRIRNVFQGQRKRPPVPVVILGALAILLCGGLVSCQIEERPNAAQTPSDSPAEQDGEPLDDDSFVVQVSDGRTLTVTLLTRTGITYPAVEQIQIYEGDERIQTIEPSSIPLVEGYEWDGLYINRGSAVGAPDIRDMNFDGAEDFGLLAVSSYPHNIPYSYFLWNEGANCFDYAFTLFRFDDLVVDAERRQLVERTHSNGAHYATYYEYAPDGSLRPIRSQTAVFSAILEDLYYDRVFLDGSLYKPSGPELAQTDFAVYDIDGDGKEELILRCMDTDIDTEGCQKLIYTFDEGAGRVSEQFWGYPHLTFYDNDPFIELPYMGLTEENIRLLEQGA